MQHGMDNDMSAAVFLGYVIPDNTAPCIFVMVPRHSPYICSWIAYACRASPFIVGHA